MKLVHRYKKIKYTFYFLLAILVANGTKIAWARPLFTQEVSTLGLFTFESGLSLSQREDAFNSPRVKDETIIFPFYMKIGLSPHLDFGFTLRHVSHHLKFQGTTYTGSSNAQFSPEIKYSPWESLGFLAIWHTAKSEHPLDNLPIAQGNDAELFALFKLPTSWNCTLNVGYDIRGKYNSQFGVSNAEFSHVEPGNIFESRAAMEIPLRWNLSLLNELAYYNVTKEKINQINVPESNGDAMDALVGITWTDGNWNIGTGIGFGLLDEKHTSFDLERGMGDTTYKFSLSYKLTPKKPEL